MQSVIAAIEVSGEEWLNITKLMSGLGFSIQTVQSLEGLEALVHETDWRIVLLDLDLFPVDNRFFRSLKMTRPDSSIFVVSSRPFHPELKESMSTHICACFRKPLDSDELLFWLKAVSHQPGAGDPTDETPG